MSFRDKDDVSGYTNPQDPLIFRARCISNKDDTNKGRFRCRMDHQNDEINHADEKLEYFQCLTPETSFKGLGYNPRYVNGDELVCIKINGQNFILGSSRAMGEEGDPEGEKSGINPWTLDGNASPKDGPACQESGGKCGWQGQDKPTQIHETPPSYLTAFGYEEDKAKQGREKTKNEYGNRVLRYKDPQKALSIARSQKFDDSQQVMDFIEKRIQNKGAALEEILPMLQSLKKVNGKNNPPAIQAVGPQNYIKFIGQLTSFFPALAKASKQQKQDNKEEEEKQKREQEQLERAYELLLAEQEANDGQV